MPRKVISVIGGLSHDTIHRSNQSFEAGGAVRTEKHVEPGGDGANIAIAAWRASHDKPDTEDGLLPAEPRAWSRDEDDYEVRIIGAVCNMEWNEIFRSRMMRNGVEAEWITLKTGAGEQDYCTSFMDGRTGVVSHFYNFESSNQWTEGDFDTIEKIGGGTVPDLVVVTMELKTRVVERIIEIASSAGVEVVLYASPGESLLAEHYQMITHLICDENDAAKMLGFKLEDVNMDNWPDIVDNFYTSKGVRNVVLKVGHLGAYYKNDQGEGYASGYKRISEIIDETGATPAFVGNYVVELLKHRETGDWSIEAAVQRCNAASTKVVSQLGYETSIPWRDEINAIEDNPKVKALYANLDVLRSTPKKVVFGRKGKR